MAGLSPRVEDRSLIAVTLSSISGWFAQLWPLLLISGADFPALHSTPPRLSQCSSPRLHCFGAFLGIMS